MDRGIAVGLALEPSSPPPENVVISLHKNEGTPVNIQANTKVFKHDFFKNEGNWELGQIVKNVGSANSPEVNSDNSGRSKIQIGKFWLANVLMTGR